MDEAKIIAAATAGTASLATGHLANMIIDLRESYKQMAYNHAEMSERLEKVEKCVPEESDLVARLERRVVDTEKRLDAASKAFAALKAERQIEPASTQRPEPTDQ